MRCSKPGCGKRSYCADLCIEHYDIFVRDAVGQADDGKILHVSHACPHDFSGPEVDIGGGKSVTCVHCGMTAFDHSLWEK